MIYNDIKYYRSCNIKVYTQNNAKPSLAHGHTHREVGVHSSTTEGSLFSECDTINAVRLFPFTCAQEYTTHAHAVRTNTHTHTSGPVFWFPGCPIVLWQSLINGPLCICVCVCVQGCDSSVSPAGLMSHSAFPWACWHYSAQLITHHHLRSSRVLWHESQNRHTHFHNNRSAFVFCFD